MATDFESGLAAEARSDPNFPYHSSLARLQAEYILKNVDALCQAAGTSTRNLVKRRVHHTDLRDVPRAEAVWRAHLGDRLPPTSVLRTTGPLPVPDCTIQYDLIAHAP
jgi:enamine deaminase RidA (YjgF/YER057c/UK114 family)